MIGTLIYKCVECANQPCTIIMKYNDNGDDKVDLMSSDDKKRCVSCYGSSQANFKLVGRSYEVESNEPKKDEKKIENLNIECPIFINLTAIEFREAIKAATAPKRKCTSKKSDVKPEPTKPEIPYIWHTLD